MTANRLGAAPRSVPAGALLALSLGLALYQLSALSSVSAGERVIPISLQMPSVELQLADPFLSDANTFLGRAFTATVSSISIPLVQQMAVSVVSTPIRTAAVRATSSAPGATPVSLVAPADKAEGRAVTHYHDADERSPGLARRR